MKIQYCPICTQELIEINGMKKVCPFCKAAFYITVEYSIDSPCLAVIDDEGEWCESAYNA